LRSGITPLHHAARDGHKETVELLIANGADVNAKMKEGTTPLHFAASKGHKEIDELLIAKDADVNAIAGKELQSKTPLDEAIKTKRTETADLLRAHGGKTREELNALIDAAKNGDIEAVKQHLAAGADVNAKSVDGTTRLHKAAVYGHNEVAELLIANGAEVNAIIVSGRNQGKTPLDLAIWRKKNEAADLLRQHGGRTGEELALMPRLEYGKDRWPFGFSFNAKDGMTYVVEVTQDFKQWGELETIEGTGKQVKFIDPRQPLVQFKRNFYRVKVVE
jgi:ankyrin repeat protein